jgi:hypothetical protein
MGTPTYATREAVKRALESAESARNNTEIDEALATATSDVNSLLRRIFWPRVVTFRFPWPSIDQQSPSALWLDPSEELISITTLTAGGQVIPGTGTTPGYYLEPVNQGPPYNQVQINRGSNFSFQAGPSNQRSIQIDGLAGYKNITRPAGALAENLDTTETDIDVTNGAVIGVGDLITVTDERMIVVERLMITTGQTLQTPVGASNAEVVLAVTNGALYFVGETILLDAERMLIVDIAGNNLIVKRPWDGTVLAAHAGSTIYSPRTLTVERGALGTTAAVHSTADAVRVQVWPGTVAQLGKAEAINTLLQSRAGWGRTTGSGDNEREMSGKALRELRDQAMSECGVQLKTATI